MTLPSTPKAFYRGTAPTATTTVYTVPSAGLAVVTNLVASNPGNESSSITVRLAGVPLLSSVGIAPHGGLLTLDVRQVIAAGDTIDIQGTGALAHVHISGAEIT